MKRRRATIATHPAATPDGSEPDAPPLSLASVHRFKGIEQVSRAMQGLDDEFFYRRHGNLNNRQLEECIRGLEGAEAAVATTSGMGACASIFLALSVDGDHVLSSPDLYGGTTALFNTDLPGMGVTVTYAEPRDMERALRPNTRFIFVESISNPLTHVADLPGLSKLARKAKATLIVDNTFATPILCRPLDHGAHIVYHSCTKFINGHGDAVAGVVAGPAKGLKRVRGAAIRTGLTASPMDSWLTLRGARTLEVRMERISRNALQIARWLERQSKVARVHYPGLTGHRDRRTARRLLREGSGGIVSFELRGRPTAAHRLIRSLQLVPLTPSLGNTHTTLTHPWSTSHSFLPESVRRARGITPGLIRLSIGIDDPGDVRQDLAAALRKV